VLSELERMESGPFLVSRSGHRVVRSFVCMRRAERADDCEGRC
jgi:hypothetical protein